MGRCRWVLALASLTGCDAVFDLELPAADAALADANLDLCPPSYAPVQGGATRYRFILDKHDWVLAQADCADDSSPPITHLVELDDLAELGAVRDAFPAPDPWEAHTGYARDTTGDPFVFHATTGTLLPLGSPLWAGMEPNGGDEDATFFGHNFNLADAPWAISRFYICECDGRPVTRTFDLR